MKTKMNEINSTAELITYTLAFGIPTDTESVVRMQDIVGHETVEVLDNIAEGKNKNQLQSILFHIWDYERAVRFYNDHDGFYQETIRAAKESKKYAEALERDLKSAREAAAHNLAIWEKADAEAFEQKRRADAAEAEVMRLKAMLFDYMTKTA